MLRQAEINNIEWAVKATGAIKEAAALLEVDQHFLYKRCRALGLERLYKVQKKRKKKRKEPLHEPLPA